MRIASNKLADLLKFYFSELKNSYSQEEIKLLFQFACNHYLHFSAADIRLNQQNNINQSDVIKLYDCCLELKKNTPLQYILGECDFYYLKLKVNPSVLIPRPETEELVEMIITDCKKNNFIDADILDIGTGSGCIPIALKKNMDEANVSAIDISQNALEIAQQNALLNHTTVIFNRIDILSDEASYSLDSFDIIVSNPPYIAKKEMETMHERVKQHEPALALFVEDKDTLIFYKKIITLCSKHLHAGGKLYMELNPVYSDEIKKIAKESNLFVASDLIKDLSGNIRFLKATKHD